MPARYAMIDREDRVLCVQADLKSAELIQALQSAGVPLHTLCRGGLVVVFANFGEVPGVPAQNLPHQVHLSRRQRQVLDGLIAGLDIKDMALSLKISPRTVRLHISALKERLGVRSRLQIVSRALALGLTPGSYPP